MQKDAIFQELADNEPNPTTGTAETVGGQPFPRIGSQDEARDWIIRSHLTAPQTEIYDRDRAAEKEALRQQMMEIYRTAAAALGK